MRHIYDMPMQIIPHLSEKQRRMACNESSAFASLFASHIQLAEAISNFQIVDYCAGPGALGGGRRSQEALHTAPAREWPLALTGEGGRPGQSKQGSSRRGATGLRVHYGLGMRIQRSFQERNPTTRVVGFQRAVFYVKFSHWVAVTSTVHNLQKSNEKILMRIGDFQESKFFTSKVFVHHDSE